MRPAGWNHLSDDVQLVAVTRGAASRGGDARRPCRDPGAGDGGWRAARPRRPRRAAPVRRRGAQHQPRRLRRGRARLIGAVAACRRGRRNRAGVLIPTPLGCCFQRSPNRLARCRSGERWRAGHGAMRLPAILSPQCARWPARPRPSLARADPGQVESPGRVKMPAKATDLRRCRDPRRTEAALLPVQDVVDGQVDRDLLLRRCRAGRAAVARRGTRAASRSSGGSSVTPCAVPPRAPAHPGPVWMRTVTGPCSRRSIAWRG